MKRLVIIALSVTLFTACEKDSNELSPGTTGQTSGSEKISVARPFEITFTSTVDPNPAIPPTQCSGDLPGFATGGLFLQGTATHLGLIDASQSRLDHVSCNLSFATALLTTSIAGQITSADGDLIYYTGNDEINVFNLLTGAGTTGTITGVWTITGGTGRFEGATGSFTINGPVDFTTSTISGTGIGTITY